MDSTSASTTSSLDKKASSCPQGAMQERDFTRLQHQMKQYQQALQRNTEYLMERNNILLLRIYDLKQHRGDLLNQNHKFFTELQSMKKNHEQSGISTITISDERTDELQDQLEALRRECSHKNQMIRQMEEVIDTKSAMICRLAELLVKERSKSFKEIHRDVQEKSKSGSNSCQLIPRSILLSPKVIGRFICAQSVDCDSYNHGEYDDEEAEEESQHETFDDTATSPSVFVDPLSTSDYPQSPKLETEPDDEYIYRFRVPNLSASEDEDKASSEEINVIEDPEQGLDQDAIRKLMKCHVDTLEDCNRDDNDDAAVIAVQNIETEQREHVFCDEDDEMSEEQDTFPKIFVECTGPMAEIMTPRKESPIDEVTSRESGDAEHMNATVTAYSHCLYGDVSDNSTNDSCEESWFSTDDPDVRFDFKLDRAIRLGASPPDK